MRELGPVPGAAGSEENPERRAWPDKTDAYEFVGAATGLLMAIAAAVGLEAAGVELVIDGPKGLRPNDRRRPCLIRGIPA